MPKLLLRTTLAGVLATTTTLAQFPGLTLPPSGNNQKAVVTQFIGPVKISIDYSSPAVHGPDGKDRRGQIWGKLVPYGLTSLGFGNGKPGPWRAGANENTVFATSHDVLVEGMLLAAGRYGLHMITGPDEWTVIFSKDSDAWGSFFYDDSRDALRIKVKPRKHEYREWLTYDFTSRKPSEARFELQWEDLAVPVNIKVQDIDQIYVTRLSRELTSSPGFSHLGYMNAAQYTIQSGKHLDYGLKWAEAAIAMPGIGVKNFNTIATKAQVLAKMGKDKESAELMRAAVELPGTTPFNIHQYGRQLLTEKKAREALEVFEINAKRNGDAWPVHVGHARGYAATGDNRKALDHAKKALAQAPDEINRKNLEGMVKTLSEGGSVTQ
jgi:hypothetical protein